MTNEAIRKMTRQEQLQAMEELWDALTHGDTEPESPSWHAEILASRRSKIEEGSAVFVSLEDIKADRA